MSLPATGVCAAKSGESALLYCKQTICESRPLHSGFFERNSCPRATQRLAQGQSTHTLTPNALLCASSLLLLCLLPCGMHALSVCRNTEKMQFLLLACVPKIFSRFGAAHYNTSRWAPEQPHRSPTSQTTSRSSGILNHVAYIPRVSNEPLALVGAYRGRQ
jgi:hypothetical protein